MEFKERNEQDMHNENMQDNVSKATRSDNTKALSTIREEMKVKIPKVHYLNRENYFANSALAT